MTRDPYEEITEPVTRGYRLKEEPRVIKHEHEGEFAGRFWQALAWVLCVYMVLAALEPLVPALVAWLGRH